ncbi:glycosyltransferase family 2 protein [Terrarubrum flagellatum]|uniref:glycosyltransferase family 2 protein n=1 Tax=Terrirubrum flagellatum TaxID=2895980 RepID=UPI0031450B63
MAPPTAADRLPLSVFIIAFNEADRIGRTLDSVAGLVDEIIVIDSRSTDETREIAAGKGARVIERDWPGYGLQKGFGQDQCRHLWAMNLDADEVVTPELAIEIRALFAGGVPPLDGYILRQADLLPGETRLPLFPSTLDFIRLYRRDRGRYSTSPVHDVVDMRPGARVGKLKAPLQHYGVRDVDAHLAKLLRYAKAQVDDLAARRRRLPFWRRYLEYPAAFIRAYVFRRYFLRGRIGFEVARNYAIYRHQRVAMALDRQKSDGAAAA